MPRKKTPVEIRFWPKVNIPKDDPDACWEWAGSTPEPGYGRIWINGRYDGAHRAAWMIHHKREIPAGMQICHHCDNPRCVRPDHLFLGTVRDNSLDMMRKGRKPIFVGEETSNNKLTDEDVLELRRRYSNGETSTALANEFGVEGSCVTAAISGKHWGHLPGAVSVGHARGERSAKAKMTEANVIEYRRRYAAGELPKIMATEAGVCHRVMLNALIGKTWKYLPGAISLGRRRGEGSSLSKLTDDFIRSAYHRVKNGEALNLVAKEIGVTGAALALALKGKTWKHLGLPPLDIDLGCGERKGNAKLNTENVREIRRLRADGMTQREIAERFGITNSAVWGVLSGRTWYHVR
jgi:DNA invertase Pin-like site-specific DNA recombinase